MSYKHLTTKQRTLIEFLSKQGHSIRQIAKKVGCHYSTISRELKRCNKSYDSANAQKDYQEAKSKCGRKSKASSRVIETIAHYLSLTYSPEQIANTLLKGKVSTNTIYNYLYSGLVPVALKGVLRHKCRRRHKTTRGVFVNGRSIHDRPLVADTLTKFGHFEADTVVSSRGKSKHCVATFLDKKQGFIL